MVAETLIEEVAKVIREVLGVPELAITAETTPEEVPAWDSLAHIQLVLALGRCFGVKFTTAEVLGWSKVGDIVQSISSKTR